MLELDYDGIGKRIRQLRKSKGWSQEFLAQKCGISLSFMGHIERGSRVMSLETFASVCKALDVRADELLWGIVYPTDTGLMGVWEQSSSNGTDGYTTYVRIMRSVAEIMNGA